MKTAIWVFVGAVVLSTSVFFLRTDTPAHIYTIDWPPFTRYTSEEKACEAAAEVARWHGHDTMILKDGQFDRMMFTWCVGGQ